MNIGLFFGSFNPVHIGHMAIANYMAEFADLDEVWMVVSPQNPLKPRSVLLADHHRLEMVEKAIGENYPKLKASRIEFSLPKPSYTVTTLAYLGEKHPEHLFHLIMGSDSLETLRKWKNFEVLLNENKILVFPRPGHDGGEFSKHGSVRFLDAPLMEISSTFIRKSISEGKDLRYFMPDAAYDYLKEMHFYEK